MKPLHAMCLQQSERARLPHHFSVAHLHRRLRKLCGNAVGFCAYFRVSNTQTATTLNLCEWLQGISLNIGKQQSAFYIQHKTAARPPDQFASHQAITTMEPHVHRMITFK